MDTLVSQLAAYLAAMGLLGLALGWWLGRHSSAKRSAESMAQAKLRLETLENEQEEDAVEIGRLAEQLAQSKIELEEAREGSQTSAAERRRVEAEFADMEQQIASFEPLLAQRDAKLDELRAERATLRESLRAHQAALEADARQAREQLAVLTRRLASAQARASEFEADAARAEQRAAELAAEAADSAAPRGEIERLQGVEEENRRLEDRLVRHQERARLQVEEADRERERLTAELAALNQRLERAESERSGDDGAAEAARGELAELRERVERRDRTIATLERTGVRSSELEREVEDLRAELRASGRRVEDLESRVAAAEAARLSAETQRDRAERELEALLATPLIDVDRMATARPIRFDEDAAREPAPAGKPDKPDLLEVPRGAGDDLRRIRGIGEVLARTLNALGVYHFSQIANWSESDIQWVAAHIDTFPDRIVRDRWREQAAELASEPAEPLS